MTDFGTDCATRLAMVLTCCALAFSAPFALGREGLIDARAWDSAAASGSVLTLTAFVAHFPDSRFALEARARIAELRGPRVLAVRTPPATQVSYVQ